MTDSTLLLALMDTAGTLTGSWRVDAVLVVLFIGGVLGAFWLALHYDRDNDSPY